MKKLIFLLLASAFTLVLKAQILTQATTPQNIGNYIPGYSQVSAVNTVSFSYTPDTAVAAKTPVDGDTTTEDNGVYNYGTILASSIPLTSGNYTSTTSGKVWTVRISIPNALNIGLRFTLFNLAPTAEMYVYNDAKTVLKYKIKKADFSVSDTVSISPITGNAVTVYIVEPGNFNTFQSNITIGKVVAGYLNVDDVGPTGGTTLSASPAGTMGTMGINCMPLMMCYSQYMPTARAVARTLIPRNSRYAACTGTLINNEKNDGRAYFLTAFHCVDANKDNFLSSSEIFALRQAIFQFQFWRTTCNGTVNNTGLEFAGATLRASSRASDVVLLELLNPPGIGDEVNYAGWNRQTATPSNTSSFIIHHPGAQDMRFTQTRTVSNFFFNGNYWNAHYSAGAVTRGSSGSALFNENTQIVGQLKGGWSSCTFTDFGDRYGKFDRSWSGAFLQQWLSPAQNLMSTQSLILSSVEINGPSAIACNGGTGQYSVPNLIDATYDWVVSSNLRITNGLNTSAITISNLGGGNSGTITVTIRTPTKGRTRFLTINKSIGTGAPIVNISAVAGACNGTYQTWTLTASSPNNVTSWQWTKDPSATGSWTIYSPNSASTNVSVSGGGGGISVTATSACGTTKNGVTIYSNCPAFAIAASPNPATNEVTVATVETTLMSKSETNTQKNKIYRVEIVDQYGNIKKKFSYAAGVTSTKINVSDLVSGTYIIHAYNGKVYGYKQVVVVH